MLESTGVGFTVIVNVSDGPGQSRDSLLKVGVTTRVDVIGVVPGLVAVNDRLPAPSVPRPIAVLLFVHSYEVIPPVFALVNVTDAVVLLQTTRFPGLLTCPSGLTVIVNVSVGPVHPVPPLLKSGVTIIVATKGVVPALVEVNDISPAPLTGNPIAALLFVQV